MPQTTALHTLTVHIGSYQTHYAMLDGREYLVAPAVPIVEGVLNDYLVPATEIGAFVEAWNGIPLPLNHPQNDYGDYVSANSPEMLAQSLGRFFNARMEQQKLVGEVWLDIEKCERLGGEAAECLARMRNGDMIEISTAFWPNTEYRDGIWNGQRYKGIHRNLRPDHLALLPNAIGACSCADGCGVRTCQCKGDLMAHEEDDKPGKVRQALKTLSAFILGAEGTDTDETPPEPDPPAELTANLTHDDIRMALCAALCAEHTDQTEYYSYDQIMDVENGQVVYMHEGVLVRRAYTVGDGGAVTLQGEPEAVQRVTQYIPLAQQASDDALETEVAHATEKGDLSMLPKPELIQRLVTHEQTAWTEEQTPVLEALEERILEQMLSEADRRTGQAPLTLDALKTFLKAELDTRDAAFEQKLATYTQQAEEKNERAFLTGQLIANGWKEEDTLGLTLNHLRKIHQTLDPVSYAGLGMPRFGMPNPEEDDRLPSSAPKWD